MTILATVFASALMASSAASQAEVRNVRFFSPKISVSRAHADSEAYVFGIVRVDMSFAKNTARTPVLRLACLCEVDGALTVRCGSFSKLHTYEIMRDGEKTAALKASGLAPTAKEREAFYADPAKFTPYLPEVTKASFAGAAYGTGEVGRGFFRLGRSAKLPKVLLYRIELWQNGVLVAKGESSRAGLGRYEIPDDWHVWKRHPQKFRYVADR